jgi:LysM repeat protein
MVNMDSDTPTPQSLIEAARRALKNGDRRTARHAAEQAAALAPQLEEPWLVLAYLASPKAAQFYLDRALQLNPNSAQALAAQTWLKKQSDLSVPVSESQTPPSPASPEPTGSTSNVSTPISELPPAPAAAELTQPAISEPDASSELLPSSAPVEPTRPSLSAPFIKPELPPSPAVVEPTSRQKRRFPLWQMALAGLAALAVILAGMAFLIHPVPSTENTDATLVSVVQTVLKSEPTKTSTFTASPTRTTAPTSTSTQTHTPSPSPTVTASPVPSHTATPLPTNTPLASPTQPKNTQVANASYSVIPGDTLMIIAQRFNIPLQSLIAANTLANPSFIQVGQVLTIPKAGALPIPAQPSPTSNPVGPSNNSGKEIQIDISEQHLYAYQDSKLVFSLVVSTGMGNSTRIGTFKVLDKIPNAFSNAFNIWMPYWMGIYYSGTLENGIHGLPLLTNGVELWGNLLGKPATYGCIESRTPDIKKLYDWAEIGIPVIIRR